MGFIFHYFPHLLSDIVFFSVCSFPEGLLHGVSFVLKVQYTGSSCINAMATQLLDFNGMLLRDRLKGYWWDIAVLSPRYVNFTSKIQYLLAPLMQPIDIFGSPFLTRFIVHLIIVLSIVRVRVIVSSD